MSNNQNTQKGARIHAQLATIMAAVEAVGKSRRNQQQGFNFRGIEDIMDAMHPIFAEHKVFVLSSVVDQKTEERQTKSGGNLIYRILTVDVSFVSGEDGSRETVRVVGEGMDSGDKAANKAMSAALKYAITQTLILPFAQVDGDADSPPPSTPKAAAPAPQANAEPNPAHRSAYDGRALKPGENPLPPAAPMPPPQAPPSTQRDETAFHSRLYNAMTLCGISDEELKAYLVKKGIITAAVDIGNLPDRIVTAMLDGKDKKSGRNNWELIADAIKQAKGASK
jgi:hypothetical protein